MQKLDVHEHKKVHRDKKLTIVQVNQKAISHNLNQYKSIVGPHVTLAPVLKSNAYGHGILLVAQLCEHHSAVGMICVVALSEAIQLRLCGITKPLLVISIIDADPEQAILLDIALIVYDLTTADQLNLCAATHNKKARVHIKINTGMYRLGIHWHKAATTIQKIYALSHVKVEGLFSHFATAAHQDQSFLRQQMKRFTRIQQLLTRNGIIIPFVHICNSAGITATSEQSGNLVRLGIGLYGLWPSQEHKVITLQQCPTFILQPALSWKTTIIHIQTIAQGEGVGYDLTWRAPIERVIAALPVGYWDGYNRALSNKSSVMVHNKLAPIIGRVAMNLSMIDVTHIPEITVGDTVTLLGNHPGITANDLAQHAGTIHYEIVTRINPMLPRIPV